MPSLSSNGFSEGAEAERDKSNGESRVPPDRQSSAVMLPRILLPLTVKVPVAVKVQLTSQKY